MGCDYINKDFCREQHEKLTEDIHQFELEIIASLTKTDTELSHRMDILETHFNDTLREKIAKLHFRNRLTIAVVSALSGAAGSIILSLILSYIR